MPIPVALIGPFTAASVVTGPAQRVGSAPIRVWMNVASSSRNTSGLVVVSRSANTRGQSIAWAVVIASIPLLELTLDGLTKNHATTFIHSATTCRAP